MPNIEVEIRSFVSREQFDRLAELFTQSCGMSAAETQETWYLDANHDLRLFRNGNIAKIVLKKGKIHDEQREELEVQCKNDDFSKLTSLFSALGHEPKIKWFRKRHAYLWDGITVTLDDTKGYGLIIELELLCEE